MFSSRTLLQGLWLLEDSYAQYMQYTLICHAHLAAQVQLHFKCFDSFPMIKMCKQPECVSSVLLVGVGVLRQLGIIVAILL